MDRLGYFRLFHPLPERDYDRLISRLKSRGFRKGDSIVVPGQVQHELYFINEGVQMSYAESDRKIHVIAFTYPPNLCALPESFSFQAPSRYHLVSLTDSEMEYITFSQLQELFQESQEIERLFRRMTEAVLAGMINRHVELHAMSIEERYRIFCERSPHLLQLVPHKYIASYLGIDATNFSKLYNSVRI